MQLMHEVRFGYSTAERERKRCTIPGQSRQSCHWSSAPMAPCACQFLPRCLVAVAPDQARPGREAGGSRWERPRESRQTERLRGKERAERERARERGKQRCPPGEGRRAASIHFWLPLPRLLVDSRRDSTSHLPLRYLPTACPPPGARCPLPAAAHSHGPRGYWLQIGISGGMRGLARLITDTCRFGANVGHKIPGYWSKPFRGGIPNGACGLARLPVSHSAPVGVQRAGRQRGPDPARFYPEPNRAANKTQP